MNFQGYMMHGEEPHMHGEEEDARRQAFEKSAKLLALLTPEQQAQALWEFLQAEKSHPDLGGGGVPDSVTLQKLIEARQAEMAVPYQDYRFSTFDFLTFVARKGDTDTAVFERFHPYLVGWMKENSLPEVQASVTGGSNTMLWVLGGIAAIGLAWHLTRKRGA